MATSWVQWSNCTAATSNTITDCWVEWTDNWSTTATTTNATAWTTWTAADTSATQIYFTPPYEQPPETEAQKAERLARHERYLREQEEKRVRAEAATKRAEDLLWTHLTDEQRAEYKRSKSFIVEGCSTKRKYRVRCGMGITGNVHELDNKGETRRRLCAHISHSIGAPSPDHYLAQKLMLEHQEEDFLRVANDHGR